MQDGCNLLKLNTFYDFTFKDPTWEINCAVADKLTDGTGERERYNLPHLLIYEFLQLKQLPSLTMQRGKDTFSAST